MADPHPAAGRPGGAPAWFAGAVDPPRRRPVSGPADEWSGRARAAVGVVILAALTVGLLVGVPGLSACCAGMMPVVVTLVAVVAALAAASLVWPGRDRDPGAGHRALAGSPGDPAELGCRASAGTGAAEPGTAGRLRGTRVGRGSRLRRPGLDELTGLPGRRHFLEIVGRCLAGGEHRARGGSSAALLVIDLDRLRDVNVALGHDHGDRLLVTVGRRLRAALPGSDVLARVDGGAFAVLLRGADVSRAERVAGRLREVLEVPVPLAGTPVRPGASVGIAHAPEHGRGALELFRHAEEAMYRAKQGRCGQSVYDRAGTTVNRARLALRAEIRQALETGQLELSYQPKADLRSGRISGMEALVRWRHPVDGVRPPEVFLTELDRAGLMPRLTVHVLDMALADCARWHAGGAPLAVSVNVPASVIVDRGFVGVVRAALARHRLPPSALVVEVTEDSLIAAREAAKGTLAGLRGFGVRVSLDDYGSGYCSLLYLRELPADEVKLDRALLRDLDRDPAAAEIVRSTVSLAHALRLRIVAEGVETQRSWASLAAWQCDEVQGFFVSRPMAGDRVVGWLREWGSRLVERPEADVRRAEPGERADAAADAAARPTLLGIPAAEPGPVRRSVTAGAVSLLVAPPLRPGQWSTGFRGAPPETGPRRAGAYRVQADLAAS